MTRIRRAPEAPHPDLERRVGFQFHEPMQRAWTPYLDGDRTLDEAAADLVRALDD